MFKITKDIIKKVYFPRPVDSHKYDRGLLLVIGGGQFYTGAPALSAMAALRAGVDMAQVLAPKRAADIIASFSPNLAAYPLQGDWLDMEDVPSLLSFTKAAQQTAGAKTAVVIGGGLGRTEETKKAVNEYLQQIRTKLVIDADGLHAVAIQKDLLKGKNYILTPNLFEFFILTGKKIDEFSFEDKIQAVKDEAQKLGCIILLKGAKDIISDGQEVAIDESGTPYMAIGGTGDTLAGICGSLLAQDIEPFLAAQAGSYINGKAGEAAAKKFGQGMVATDLVEEIANVIKF